MKMDAFLKSACVIGLFVLVLTGCSSNGIHDQAIGGNALFDTLSGKNRMAALATTADYRTVVVNTEKNLACPEPSPDVGQAVSRVASIAARLDSGKDPESIGANINALTGSLKDITPLLKRTRGIQLYRDARSYNCFSNMNGALSGNELVKAERRALEAAKLLLLAEILTNGDTSTSADTLEAPNTERLTQLMEDLQNFVNTQKDSETEAADHSETDGE